MNRMLPLVLAAVICAPDANAAEEGLPARAAATLGLYIASQGNAALVQIREEFRKDVLKRIEPYLPSREEVAPDARRDDTRPAA